MDAVQLTLFGRTSRELSTPAVAEIFKRCWKKSQRPIFQYLNLENGQNREWFEGAEFAQPGDSLTLNIGESPSEESVSTLSAVLEPIVPLKYFLSATACNGILRRAKNRHKALPPLLEKALEEQAEHFAMTQEETVTGVEFREEQSPTLTTTKNADVVYAIGNGQTAQMGLHDLTYALDCMHDQQAVIYTIDRAALNQAVAYGIDCRNFKENEELFPTLQAKENGGISLNFYGAVIYKLYLTLKWIVRRLTPRECERLQGYPDDWTVLPKISEMSDADYEFYKAVFLLDKAVRGKANAKEPDKKQLIRWYNGLDNDGARYRMLGNSLAIPCALRVIGYIADYEKRGYSNGQNYNSRG